MKKIFIIEDDINILYGLRDIFSSNDYDVEINDSKDEIEDIVKSIQKFRPDAIILDLVLPKIDGLEILKSIKDHDDIAGTEIFVFTDLSDEDGKTRSIGMGVNYYFMKNDFDIYAFSSKVMRIMERSENTLVSEDSADDESDVVID
jgi:DNA-binding response OmpR family regulator